MNRKQVHSQTHLFIRILPAVILFVLCVLFLTETQTLWTSIADRLKVFPQMAKGLLTAAFLGAAVLPILLKRDIPFLNLFVTVASVVLIFLILFDIASKTVLRRDDYWEIYEAQHRGFPGYFEFIFMTNSGRYSAFLIKMLYAVFPPLAWIRFTIFLCGILLLLCCYGIARRLCANRTQSFFLAVVLFSGIYLVQTKIWESFFWGGGGHIYSWGIICALAAWIFFIDTLKKPSRARFIASLILAFLSSGFAQLINLTMIFLSGVLLLYTFIDKENVTEEQRKASMLFFVVLVISTVIAFAMPGNYANASQFFEEGSPKPSFQSLVQMLIDAVLGSFAGVHSHLSSQRNNLILLGLICFLSGFFFSETLRPSQTKLKNTTLAVLIVWVAAFFSPIINGVLGYFSTRIYSVPLTMVWLGIAVLSLTTGALIGSQNKITANTGRIVLPGLFIIVCLWLNFYLSERPQMNRIYRTWIERDQQLTQLAASGAVIELNEAGEFETCAVEISGTNLPDLPYGTYGWVIGRYYGLPPLTAETFCE